MFHNVEHFMTYLLCNFVVLSFDLGFTFSVFYQITFHCRISRYLFHAELNEIWPNLLRYSSGLKEAVPSWEPDASLLELFGYIAESQEKVANIFNLSKPNVHGIRKRKQSL